MNRSGFFREKGKFRPLLEAWNIPEIAELAQNQCLTANHAFKKVGYVSAVLRGMSVPSGRP